MAKVNSPASATEPFESDWNDASVGFGNEWDFEHDGKLTGFYLGEKGTEVDDNKEASGKRYANVYQFAPREDEQDVVFIWGSANLNAAMADPGIKIGSLVEVSYIGTRQFTDKKTHEPRIVKQYKVRYRN